MASLAFAAPLNCSVSWIGNSYPGGDGGWVPQDVQDIFVTPDGTAFTTVPWEEHRGNIAAFKDGKLIQQTAHWKNGGIDREVGSSICATAKHIFFATDKGRFLARRDRADVTSRKAEKKAEVGVEIRGVAASADKVYAACEDERVRVFDHELNALGEWPAPAPGELCADADGNVWIIDTSSHALLHFDPQGKPLAQRVTFADGVIPADVAITPDGKLLVADGGPKRQVLIYHHVTTAPALEKTLGEPGGIFAGPAPGKFGEQRFIAPIGVGADAQGNVYVASGPCAKAQGGSTVIESYAPDVRLNWRVLSTEWLDTAGADATSAVTVLYGSKHRYTLDLGKEAGRQWSVAGLTLNPDKHPDDPRLVSAAIGGVWPRKIRGQPYLFMPDMNGGNLFVFRFDPSHEGETAIPCACLGTKEIWADTNGNGSRDEGESTPQTTGETRGWYVEDNGTVWQAARSAGIFEYPVSEMLGNGVPAYTAAARRHFAAPAAFKELRRIFYDRTTDTMYLGGSTAADPAAHWKPMGPNLVRYDHWSREKHLAWHLIMPHEQGKSVHESFEPFDFAVEGGYVFVVYAGRLPSQDLPTGTVMIFDKSDRHLIGHLQPPGTRTGAVPMDALQDMVHSLNVCRRADGEYLILIEDDGYTKNLMYRWQP